MISIAVIHHMSTRERRIQAIRVRCSYFPLLHAYKAQELFRLLRHGGTMLITVWAFEQVRYKNEFNVIMKNITRKTRHIPSRM